MCRCILAGNKSRATLCPLRPGLVSDGLTPTVSRVSPGSVIRSAGARHGTLLTKRWGAPKKAPRDGSQKLLARKGKDTEYLAEKSAPVMPGRESDEDEVRGAQSLHLRPFIRFTRERAKLWLNARGKQA